MENEYYIYLHVKLNTGEPFYIGKGKGQRAFQKTGRNNRWKKLVNKYDYDIIILEEGYTDLESCEREKYWIKRIGRNDLNLGPLVNMTDGGEGTEGSIRIFNEEHRKKLSEAAKKRIYTKEDCKKMGVKKGNIPWNKGKPMSEEQKNKLRKPKKKKEND